MNVRSQWPRCLSEIERDAQKVIPVIKSRMVVRYGNAIFAEGIRTVLMHLLTEISFCDISGSVHFFIIVIVILGILAIYKLHYRRS